MAEDFGFAGVDVAAGFPLESALATHRRAIASKFQLLRGLVAVGFERLPDLYTRVGEPVPARVV